MANQYRVCIVGCGRMGGTIDEEVRGGRHPALPYSHAAGYTAYERTTIVAASDVVAEKAEYVCSKWNIPKQYADYREMIEKEKAGYRQRSNPSGKSRGNHHLCGGTWGERGVLR